MLTFVILRLLVLLVFVGLFAMLHTAIGEVSVAEQDQLPPWLERIRRRLWP